jgi:hypothetical protein
VNDHGHDANLSIERCQAREREAARLGKMKSNVKANCMAERNSCMTITDDARHKQAEDDAEPQSGGIAHATTLDANRPGAARKAFGTRGKQAKKRNPGLNFLRGNLLARTWNNSA